MALALASAGFGVIATFITLFYDAKGWDGAAFALTLFQRCAFVGARLLFPNAINRLGGLNVAMLCFSVEAIGLLLVGFADTPMMAVVPAGLAFRWSSRRWMAGGESGAATQSGVGAGDPYRVRRCRWASAGRWRIADGVDRDLVVISPRRGW